ncbi:WSC-domain-containing protein [Tothia fuscella]|uniref:WSC-domain-containing protein n=1 Tax=Tothia fuscella TaxID=1048955 RepID=A0A9P4NLI7_9PEZI|nr:WSC-domain-containing protein [Tothia fuscella]
MPADFLIAMAFSCSLAPSVPKSLLYLYIFSLITGVASLGASTDTYTWGGDYLRNGYQPNHNMDPAVVGSANFGQLFKTSLPGNFNGIGPEQVFSQPLVFTGNDGVQYVYLATTQNNIYKLNAKTGAIVSSRNMHVPFLTADLDGCVDINPTVGVTATGTIDPATGIWYVIAKTYSEPFQNSLFGPTNSPGRLNGRYYFHGIDTQSANLTAAFAPVMIDGRTFRNNPSRMFQGGNQHSRPGLVLAGDYVYTGYASHCVQYNFTGAIIGHDKTTGAVVEMFATEGGPEPITVKGGGVWMSGGGITYDGSGSLFFASGNGFASQLSITPIPGRQPPSALEQAAVNAKINSDGTLSIIDFFIPFEKQLLDGADKDLGTTPLEILPTSVFTCPNVKRMGIVTGKSGKTYVLNLDNLGGYQMGPNKLDNVVFVYQNENSVYAGAGVMPLGGGYIYINIIKYQTRVFKFSCDGSGAPQFTVVANTAEYNANILGTGHGTTTSLSGQDGSGLYWVSDVEGLNLRIYNAIPPSGGGPLTLINKFNIPGLTKFTRPVFGDGRVYLGTTTGFFYGYGSPVNLPLNCSSPNAFGQVPLKNSSAPRAITCIALIGTTVTGVALSGNNNFKVSNLPTSTVVLAKGGSFSFQAVFNPQSVGPLSSDAIVNTTTAVAGYSINTPITLTGTGNSLAPLLRIAPNTVSFNIISGQQTGGVNQSSIFTNAGDATLNIQNISYSLKGETGPWVTPNITSSGVQVGPFTFYSVPKTIPGNSQSTFTINYNPTAAGNHGCFLSVASDGGTVILNVVAVAGTNPTALVEFERYDGSGWTKLDSTSVFTFGNVTESQTRNLKLRVTNNGSTSAVPLSITVSKPPFGVQGIVGAVNNADLAEGTLLSAGQSAMATLYCSVPMSQVNVPSYQGSANWTMNTGDPALGKLFMQFTCNAVSEQVGPLFTNGSAQYGYIGCFRENSPGRQLSTNIYTDIKGNTNDKCIAACSAAGWIYAGTQYQNECWCGNAIPIQQDLERDCNYVCTGNGSQTCGGNGYFGDKARMSLFSDLTRFKNVTSPPLSIPQSVNGYNYVGCYAEKGGKAMGAKATTDSRFMTVELCAAFCSAYPYFSVEYAQECYCGNSISNTIATLTFDSLCQTMTCKGNNSEYCGAGNYAQIYQLNGMKPTLSLSSAAATSSSPISASVSVVSTTATPLSLTNYAYMGCYNETHDRRALNAKAGGGSTNTLNSCASFCLGYSYFGVEFGSECYCANEIYVNSIKQSNEVGCSNPCAGNSAQRCGGPDYLNMYYINATSVTTPTVTAAGSTLTSTGGPIAVASAGPFKFIGCYNEVVGRALTGNAVANSSMTVGLCAAFCSGFRYFSVEYSQECYCGNAISPGSSVSASGDCSMTCAADPNEFCGGPGWMNMYQKNGTTPTISNGASIAVTTNTVTSATAMSTSAPQRIGPWLSLGCYTDNVNGRALSSIYADNTMTLELCASKAMSANAQYFGVEYGIECWYGSSIIGGNAASPQAECNMKCPGNPFEWCGSGNRLQIGPNDGFTFVIGIYLFLELLTRNLGKFIIRAIFAPLVNFALVR